MSESDVGQRTLKRREYFQRQLPLHVYVAVVLIAFIIASAVGLGYARTVTTRNDRVDLTNESSYAAKQSKMSINDALTKFQVQERRLARTQLPNGAISSPSTCNFFYTPLGPFSTGHRDLISTTGRVTCSSLPTKNTLNYAGASWLRDAMAGTPLIGPVLDTRTGQEVIIIATPLPGHGAAVTFLNVDRVATNLNALYGGPSNLQFLITSNNGASILSSSIDPRRMAQRLVSVTRFSNSANNGTGKDVVGTTWVYRVATVPSLGWTIYAGESATDAFTNSNNVNQNLLWIFLLGFLLLCAVSMIIYRRLARPIRQLSRLVGAAASESGNVTHVEISPTPREITELVEQVEHLLEVDRREGVVGSRLTAVVDSSDAAIFSATLDGVITSWSAGCARLYGYEGEDIVGKSLGKLTILPKLMAQGIDDVRRDEETKTHESEHMRNDGSSFFVEVALSPIRDREGRVNAISVVIKDNTRRKRSDAERRSLEERMEQSQRFESLGQLAGGVAHDFNNLLSVIINYAAFARKALPDVVTSDTSEQVASIENDVAQISLAANRAATLTHQLLAFASREIVEPRALDLNEVIRQILPLLERTLGEDVEIVAVLPSTLSSALLDQSQVEQVLVNLAVNARDAMPGGGVITIQTSNVIVNVDDIYEIGHGSLLPGSYVQLRVSDTGQGMNADVAKRVFEPFFTTKPTGEGTGLGLATVYGIVNQAHGHVSLYSVEGSGTIVTALFPASTVTPDVVNNTPSVKTETNGKRQTILVVEDEAALLEVCRRVLSQAGYHVLTAENGPRALEVLDEFSGDIALILSDVIMPQMMGTELVEKVALIHPEAVVILMSGYTESIIDVRSAMTTGATILSKPFTQTQLLERVASTLRARAVL